MQRLFGLILFIALLAALVGGCTDTEKTGKSSGSGSSTGTIEVRVTDAPPGYEITKVLVTVSSVEVHRAVAEKEQEQAQRPEETPVQEQEQEQQQVGDGSDAIVEEDSDGNGGEWIALGILPGQETFDLLLIQDLEQVLATDEVDAGKYTQIRMAVESVVVEYMEGAGTKTAEAEVPSGKLKFVRPFDVEADSTTALVFDFIAEKSVVFTGSDKVIFKPVIKLNVSKPKPTPSPTVSPSPTASPDPTDEASEPDEFDNMNAAATHTPDKPKYPGDHPGSAPPDGDDEEGDDEEDSDAPGGSGGGSAANGSPGNLVISVTDAPPGYEITSVKVTVTGVEVHVADASQEQEQERVQDRKQDQQGRGNKGKGKDKGATPTGMPTRSDDDESDATVDDDGDSAGWMTVPVRSGSETFDLLKIQGIEQVLAEGALDPGKYTQIRMAVTSVIVQYKDASGTKTAEADVPSGKLKFVRPFSIESGKTTTLVFDFIAAKSVVFTGSGKVHFKPVIKLAVSEPVKTKTLRITTENLPYGIVGSAYSAKLKALGGTTPYTWSGTPAGTLPAWLKLNASTGVLSGTPTAVGAYTFKVQVKDSSNPVQSVAKEFTIKVVNSLTITTATLPDGIVGSAYSVTLQAAGGTPAYTWSGTPSGTLPAWLKLDASTGVLSGTPTAVGACTFKVQVKDSSNPVQSVTKEFTIKVVNSLTITTATLPDGIVGSAYSVTLQAAGGTPAYAWSGTPAGTLPAWLSLNASTGALSGTPTAAGTYAFNVQVKDGSNPVQTVTKAFTIKVVDPLSITTASLPDGTVGAAYSQTLQASGGTTPYVWGISSGALPDGFTIDVSTGVISGTPTAEGTFSFTVEVKDSSNPKLSASKSLSIVIVAPPAP